MIALPSAEEVEHYGRRHEPRAVGIPLIADDEPVCLVRVFATGSGAYWSRGDVDVHVLHARQHGYLDGLALADAFGQPAWLAKALRERREQRRHLLRAGVQTTAAGLVLLHAPAQLVIPTRP